MQKKHLQRTASALLAAAVSAALPPAGRAQSFQGLNSLRTMTSEAQSAGKYVIDFAFVAVGIIAAVMIVPNIIKAWQGDQSAKDALVYIAIGVITAIIILSIIRVVMGFN